MSPVRQAASSAMSNIPPDIYERVLELALAIVNASEAGDDALSDSLVTRSG
jgi:hypothetical protein